MMNAFHIVAKTRPPLAPLLQRDACIDLWQRLRNRFPRVAACVLMPNHLHVIVLGKKPSVWDLGVDLRAWTQRFHPGIEVWYPLPEPERIPDIHHLKRTIRYVHLNPCRARLVPDPFQWEWSTHRDVTGCTIDVWPEIEVLRDVFKTSRDQLGEEIHRYVSSDPSVAIRGTPMIRDQGTVIASSASILMACSMASRESSEAQFTRYLAVWVARELGLSPKQMTITRSVWSRALSCPVDSRSIKAVQRVLADPRCGT